MGHPEGKPAINPGLGLAISVASISTAAILIRLSSADPLAIAAARLTISTLILIPVLFYYGLGQLKLITRRDLVYLLVVGASLALHFALWVTSLEYTTVAASVLLVTTSPVFVAIFGHIFLRELITRDTIAGITLAMVGVGIVIVTGGGISGNLRGMLLALGGAVAVTVYLIGGRRLRQRLSLVVYAFCVYAIASIILLAASMAAGASLTGLPPGDYVLFLLLGIVPSHFGHTLYNYLLRFLEASVIAVSTLGEPIISSILALAILGEVPSPWILVGGPLVLVGIYVTVRGSF